MRSSRFGAIPSEIGEIVDTLDDLKRRVGTLEAPSGEERGRTIERLQTTIQQVQMLVTDLQSNLDEYIVTRLPELVAEQIEIALAGNVTIGGNLTVTGSTFLPAVPGRTFTVEARTAVWVATATGEIGRT